MIVVLVLLAGCGALKRFAYEGRGRDAWQKPDEVIALLGIRAGDRMAGDAFPEAVLFAADAFMHGLVTLVIKQ